MSLFPPRSPISAEEQSWVDTSLQWLLREFGFPALHGTVVLPTAEFFPGFYAGTASDVRAVVDLVAVHMSVDPGQVELEFHDETSAENELLENVPLLASSSRYAAAHYRRNGDKVVISVEESQKRQPMALVASIAHELGHERLLGEGRITRGREDGEPLTDLLTVFLGMGIFTANAAFVVSSDNGRRRTRELGYLSQAMFGYALARYARLRDETRPEWAGYLATNPRGYMKQSLRYLDAV
jgi:hypothetical protein